MSKKKIINLKKINLFNFFNETSNKIENFIMISKTQEKKKELD